ncbi:LTA synthase family protein [Salipaludibacillus aurantiacus]|uniref:Phosphoglycerol transferase MdoB n=1 Tax=Salipaludibacillus aurantiacus TaxID=1601833 RepID=A0A1H9V9G8_9BACI|nr:LTA synthase family protein [Salipaludibacillus aurantiacus]SES18426.1 Phosphoglycerol transferase MdoB [Salipaludibacillus aurantiacus]
MKKFLNQHRFMLFCLGVLWFKTFIVSTLTFNLTINQFLEALVFLLNPLAFLLIVFSLGLLLKPKIQRPYYFIISTLLTIVLYSNAVYYREFTDIITLPMLVMSGNAGDLSTSVFELIQWYDIFFFLDLIVIGYILAKKPAFFTVNKVLFRQSRSKYAVLAVVVGTIVVAGQIDTTDHRTHSFNRDNVIKSLGIYNFYIYDAYLHLTTSSQTVFADKEDWETINDHLDMYSVEPNRELHGAAEGMNVVVISLESVESFVINETVNGEEITPFLNELIEDSFYFSDVYDQTGQGKTSDTEFMVNNSLYPLGRGAVFHTHDENVLTPLPGALQDRGYFTASFHANDETFYNRNITYDILGYDHFYHIDYFDVTEDNSVGWGLKDIDFVEQSMPYLKEMDQPFYSTFLTLTNHFPYELDPEDHYIEPYDSESDIVSRYFPTVRYTDEAIRVLFEEMKEADLYENTMFVLYGDHYGIADSHYDDLSEYLGYEVTDDEAVKLDRVPVIIHVPGMEEEAFTADTVGGHIDIMPTVLNLLGMPEDDHVMFGRDLLSKERDDFAVQRDGSVITDEFIYTSETCFDADNGDILPLEKCMEAVNRGEWELYYSDKIIYSDLLRFHE